MSQSPFHHSEPSILESMTDCQDGLAESARLIVVRISHNRVHLWLVFVVRPFPLFRFFIWHICFIEGIGVPTGMFRSLAFN